MHLNVSFGFNETKLAKLQVEEFYLVVHKADLLWISFLNFICYWINRFRNAAYMPSFAFLVGFIYLTLLIWSSSLSICSEWWYLETSELKEGLLLSWLCTCDISQKRGFSGNHGSNSFLCGSTTFCFSVLKRGEHFMVGT